MCWMIVDDVGQGFDNGMDRAVCEPAGELFGITGVAVYPVIVASFQKSLMSPRHYSLLHSPQVKIYIFEASGVL